VHGPKAVPYRLELNGTSSRLRAGDAVTLEMTSIKNPVTGASVNPGIVLPEGIIVKRADLGASKTFRIDDAIAMEHPDRYTAVGPFEYSWP